MPPSGPSASASTSAKGSAASGSGSGNGGQRPSSFPFSFASLPAPLPIASTSSSAAPHGEAQLQMAGTNKAFPSAFPATATGAGAGAGVAVASPSASLPAAAKTVPAALPAAPVRIAQPHHQLQQLPLSSSLPRVSFRRIPSPEAQTLQEPAGFYDVTLNSFGFNTGDDVVRPEHYVRYVEFDEDELRKQVEYDMDEQDKAWLDAWNVQRKAEGQDVISYESFEIIIDRFEKEWFDMMRRVPPKLKGKAAQGGDDEDDSAADDDRCAICDDGECENSNAIVFCDGCNLAVHQDCYGIPYIPEGQWLCRKCTVSPDRAVSCVLCPHEGGAFKQTTTGKWAHLLCAMWIPETGVSNSVYMEPIDSIERIPKGRWSLKCYLCQKKMGACIQCYNRNCFTAFHVTCGRQAGLLAKSARERIDDGHGNGGSVNSPHPSGAAEDASGEYAEALHAFCHRHLPEGVEVLGGESVLKLKKSDDIDPFGKRGTPVIVPGQEGRRSLKDKKGKNKSGVIVKKSKDGKISISISTNSSSPRKAISKSARAYKKTYRVGPPLVPQFVLKRVLEYVGRLTIRKKREALLHVAKYWSLKREARRGAPLLKRLHLEPWTATSRPKEQNDEAKLKKLKFIVRLREDLEKLRMLAELVQKREMQKLKQARLIRDTLVERTIRPFQEAMIKVIEDIKKFDRQNLFFEPVDTALVPDYHDVVKNPMDWSTIRDKVDDGKYESIDEFAADINLVTDNAMLYNKPQTTFWQMAMKIKKRAGEHLAVLRKEVEDAHHPFDYGIVGSAVEGESGKAGEAPAEVRDELQMLGFEPGHPLIEALEDYSPEEMLASIVEDENPSTAPSNVVDDFIRLYHRYDPSAQQQPHSQKKKKSSKSSTQKTKEQRRAAALLGIERRKQAAVEAEEQKRLRQDAQKDVKKAVNEADLSFYTEAGRPLRESRKRRFEEIEEHSTQTPPPKRPAPLRSAPLRHAPLDTGFKVSKGPSYVYEAVDDAKDLSGIPAELEADQITENTFFKQFETGWILPEGSRRRSRPSLPPSAPPAEAPRRVPVTSSRRSMGAKETDSERSIPASLPSSDRGKRGRSNSQRAIADAQPEAKEEESSWTRPQGRGSGVGEKRPHYTEERSSSALSSMSDVSDALEDEKDEAEPANAKRPRTATSEAAESVRRRNSSRTPTRGERGRQEATKGEPEEVHQARTQPRLSGRFVSMRDTPTRSTTPSEKEQEPTEEYATVTEAWSSTSAPAKKLAVPGTVVWAKIQPFPAHPADLIDPDDKKVPPAVRNLGKLDRVLVYFHEGAKGPARTWGWALSKDIRILGDDDALDHALQYKTRNGRGIQAAYKAAMAAKKRARR